MTFPREAAGPEFLKRTVMSHIDRTLFTSAQHEEIARTGATLEFGALMFFTSPEEI